MSSGFPYPTFLLEALRSDAMRDEIDLKADTGTILDALNVRNIPGLRIPSPNKQALDRFEAAARPIRRLMELRLAESLTLASIRDALLPRLLAGGLEVAV